MRGLLAAALVEAGLVTYRDLSAQKVLPPPSDYTAVIVIFGALALFPDTASSFTSLVGWGLVVATALNFWNPATPTKLAVSGGTATVQAGKQTTVTPATTGA